MKRTPILLLLISIVYSCTTMKPLSLEREDYNGKNLRLDGYYYSPYEEGYTSFFLFENGIYLDNGSTIKTDGINKLDEIIKSMYPLNPKYSVPYRWGIFIVNGSDIKIEAWLSGSGGAYPTHLVKGKIINDTTIAISGLKGKKYDNQVDYFHFRQFSPKPDSTNEFIK